MTPHGAETLDKRRATVLDFEINHSLLGFSWIFDWDFHRNYSEPFDFPHRLMQLELFSKLTHCFIC
jgi:hypothetical protein